MEIAITNRLSLISFYLSLAWVTMLCPILVCCQATLPSGFVDKESDTSFSYLFSDVSQVAWVRMDIVTCVHNWDQCVFGDL